MMMPINARMTSVARHAKTAHPQEQPGCSCKELVSAPLSAVEGVVAEGVEGVVAEPSASAMASSRERSEVVVPFLPFLLFP